MRGFRGDLLRDILQIQSRAHKCTEKPVGMCWILARLVQLGFHGRGLQYELWLQEVAVQRPRCQVSGWCLGCKVYIGFVLKQHLRGMRKREAK